ncbi:MAG: hypothetical protein ACWGNV_13065, partial [Bacteroidales bacterium]
LGINYFGKRDPGQGSISEMPQGEQELLQVPQATVPEETQVSVSTPTGESEGTDDAAGMQPDGLEKKVQGILKEMSGDELRGREGLAQEGLATEEANEIPETDLARIPEEANEVPGTDLARIPEEEAGTDLAQVPEDTATDLALQTEAPLEQEEWTGESGAKNARWMVGAALSPLYSFRDADAGALGGGEDFESGMMAYAGGIQVSYQAAKRVAIESGVFFNRMGISIGAQGIRMFDAAVEATPMDGSFNRSNWVAVTNSIGNIVTKSGDIYVNGYLLNAASQSDNLYEMTNEQDMVAANAGIRQHLDYLELPLNLRYSVVDRTFELQLVGGMSANFLLNNYITMDTPSGTQEIGYLTNIRNVNYSGNAGLGMIYHLRSQISLRLEPRFRYFLNSVNDATLPATRPYSLGLYTGFTYTF